MYKIDIGSIEKLYKDYIKNKLGDTDLTLEYIKIINDKLMQNKTFKEKSKILNTIFKKRIGEQYLNLKKENVIKHIKEKFKDHTFLDVDNIKTEEEFNNDFVKTILKNYNIVEEKKKIGDWSRHMRSWQIVFLKNLK